MCAVCWRRMRKKKCAHEILKMRTNAFGDTQNMHREIGMEEVGEWGSGGGGRGGKSKNKRQTHTRNHSLPDVEPNRHTHRQNARMNARKREVECRRRWERCIPLVKFYFICNRMSRARRYRVFFFSLSCILCAHSPHAQGISLSNFVIRIRINMHRHTRSVCARSYQLHWQRSFVVSCAWRAMDTRNQEFISIYVSNYIPSRHISRIVHHSHTEMAFNLLAFRQIENKFCRTLRVRLSLKSVS